MHGFVRWFYRLQRARFSWQQRRDERAAWKRDVQIARERARRNKARYYCFPRASHTSRTKTPPAVG